MSSAHHAPADRFNAALLARVDVLAEVLSFDICIPSVSVGLIRIRLDR